jgi:conjugative relaxase-like TrwC/TraI family protein
MLTIRAMTDGRGYSARHLEHSDYYAENERVVGQWHGRGAALLGLSGEVRHEEFEALRQGLDPNTGDFLRQRHSVDRIGDNGETQSHARSLYDFTFSAPKSVSVLAVLAEDHRLREAHETAVAEALKEAESFAGARVRQNGANDDRMTGNMAVALYQHDTSRELDPQLHTHAVAANLTYDGTENRWKALQASGIYERRAYLTEIYRNALAREVRKCGYEIESQRGCKGRDAGFEIRGVPGDLLRKFSQRSQQRDEAIDRFVKENGRPPTDNEVAILVRQSRSDKLIEISTERLRSQQKGRLTPGEAGTLTDCRAGHSGCKFKFESPEPSLQHAQDHIFERVSVARDHEVLTEALRHGRGNIDHSELKGALSLRESRGEILRDGRDVATSESLCREQKMIERVNRGVGLFQPLGGSGSFVPSDRLRPEQKRAVDFVLTSRDRVTGICGAAGTGKTATLQELRRGLEEAGRRTLAVAPTMSAVEELQKAGFPEAVTVERFLKNNQDGEIPRNRVLIADEAGMLSGNQMSELLRVIERDSARLVVCGDTKQIQSVAACDALRVLEKESKLKTASLTEVHRQRDRQYRHAIEELRRDPESGFERLDQIGAVREVEVADRAQVVADAYLESQRIESKPGQSPSTLVVCATHAEIEGVTGAIRESLKRSGNLGEGNLVEQDVPLNWTLAQKSDPRNFRAGHIIRFHRAVKGVAKDEMLEVIRIEPAAVIACGASGAKHTITRKQAQAFEIYERRLLDVASGDRLLLTANRRANGLRVTNGELVTVSRVETDGRIRLEDGRTLPRDFKQFSHGYAVTAHRSQGKSVDAVVISGDGMRKELFYVAASRGRESITVITSDKEALHRSVGRSTARQSATELARRAAGRLERGIRRGLNAARDLARWARQHTPPKPQSIWARDVRQERSHEHGLSR